MGSGDGSEYSGHDPLYQSLLYNRIAHWHLVSCCVDQTRGKKRIPLIFSMEQDSLKPNQQSRKNAQKEGEHVAHWVVLFFCAVILLGGLILSPPDSTSHYLRIGTIPIPDTCSFKNLTGLPCPGCGLTRSIVSGMHGDFRGSLTYHRLGLLTLFYVCLQLLYHLVWIIFPSSRAPALGLGKILNRGIIVLAVLYILNWCYIIFA